MSDANVHDDGPRQPATPELPPREAEGVDLEVPAADALEQAQDVVPAPPAVAPSLGTEVPEADALEQAQEVADPDDEYDA